jgi:hypothetical protein
MRLEVRAAAAAAVAACCVPALANPACGDMVLKSLAWGQPEAAAARFVPLSRQATPEESEALQRGLAVLFQSLGEVTGIAPSAANAAPKPYRAVLAYPGNPPQFMATRQWFSARSSVLGTVHFEVLSSLTGACQVYGLIVESSAPEAVKLFANLAPRVAGP